MAGHRDIAEFIAAHRKLLVLTGAGISTASGIPDYRDQDGVRRGRLPVQGPEFRRSEAVRKRYWARSMIGWRMMSGAAPNAAHHALAALQAAGHADALITQNVDGLHARAGSSGVLELHGSIHRVVCLDCQATFARAFVQELLERANPALLDTIAQPAPDGDAHLEPDSLAHFQLPACVHCGGKLKPDVVFFGDGVPADVTRAAMTMLNDCDGLLVIGSSLMVFSGFRFARAAAQAGKRVAAINLGKTRADDLLAHKLIDAAEHALPAIARLLDCG